MTTRRMVVPKDVPGQRLMLDGVEVPSWVYVNEYDGEVCTVEPIPDREPDEMRQEVFGHPQYGLAGPVEYSYFGTVAFV